jgi:hypothetical protein
MRLLTGRHEIRRCVQVDAVLTKRFAVVGDVQQQAVVAVLQRLEQLDLLAGCRKTW